MTTSILTVSGCKMKCTLARIFYATSTLLLPSDADHVALIGIGKAEISNDVSFSFKPFMV